MTDPVEALVATCMGLDPASLGPQAFARVVAARMAARGVWSRAGYAGLLAADPPEWAAFSAELVVPETWFFRGGRPLFDHLARWLADRPARPVRVLSVPCGSGEEPYSLALALHHPGPRTVQCQIDAVDISPAAVCRTAAARYTGYSFREPGADPRSLGFQPDGDRAWVLRDPIRESVRVRLGNAADPDFLAGIPPYDLILCRNLFIYLTPAAQQQAVNNFDRLLAAEGLLAVTPAEADRLPRGRFVADGPDRFGLFRRSTSGPPENRREEPGGSWTPTTSYRPDVGSATATTPLPSDPLATARHLADAGRLDEALAACEKAVGSGATAGAFSLLGVIRLAQGAADAAADAFRRALYLDPDHPEALSQMIVLCERRGEASRAATFRRRLARADRGGAP